MGKAKYPHNSSRPEPIGIRRALEAQDMAALRIALTPRQRHFAEEYIIDFNGKAAAIRAGYATEYADRQAHILLKHEGVSAYIDHLTRTKAAKIMSVDPDYLLQQLSAIMNKEGARDGDKLRAIEMYMKHLGMFIERQEITGKDGGAIEVEQREIQQQADSFVTQLKSLATKVKVEPTIN